MSDNEPVSVSPALRRARHARWRRVRVVLSTVVSLMLVAALGGFAWGMLEEVRSAPDKCLNAKCARDAPFLELWSVRAANLLAEFFAEPAQTEAPDDPEAVARSGDPSRPPRYGSTHTKPPRTGDPTTPPDVHAPPDTEPGVKDPSVTFPPDHTSVTPFPKDPPPAFKDNGAKLDAATGELLQKAHRAFDTAWGYHLKGRPDAPEAGRDEATRTAVKYFRESKALYEAVLNRKPSPTLTRRIEDRLVNLNALLYWSLKHMRIQ